MGVLNVQMGSVGLAGVTPRVVYIDTNDTLATITTAGYLNHLVQQGFAFSESDMCCVTTRATPNATVIQVAWLEVSFVSPNWSLVPTGSPGQVVLPTIVNALVHATNITGTLSTAAANVFNLGNLSAGQSGTAGSLFSFPAAPANGFLQITAVANGAARNTIITNAALAQTTTFTLVDPGIAATNFLLTNNAGTQTIATGSLALTLGSVQALAGNLTAGSSGHAGILTSFPGTAANGSFIFAAVNSPANFSMTFSNAAVGQATVISVPDPGAATANVLLDAGLGNVVIDYQNMTEAKDFMLAAAGGAFTLTRNAQGDWSWLHAAAADTSVLGFDITEVLRAAAGRGYELTSFDVVYSIATLALVAHTVTLASTVFANNVANVVTNVAITGALATATQANPYVTNLTVNVPGFTNPAAGTSVKQVIEVTVNAGATSVYNIWGINLRFSRTIK